jgi:DNA repair ATPase RecN
MTMALTDAPSRLLPLAEELLDNRYARENLREGTEKLRDVYGRARKRRVKPSRDRKLRRQFEAAIAALDEGTAALASGRKKPKRTGRKVVVTALAVTAAGAAAALALNEDLRKSVLGSAKALSEEISSQPTNDGGSDGSAS